MPGPVIDNRDRQSPKGTSQTKRPKDRLEQAWDALRRTFQVLLARDEFQRDQATWTLSSGPRMMRSSNTPLRANGNSCIALVSWNDRLVCTIYR